MVGGRALGGAGLVRDTARTNRASPADHDKHATGTQHAHDEHAHDTDDRASTASTTEHPRGFAVRDPNAEREIELRWRVRMVDSGSNLLTEGSTGYGELG